MEGERPSLEADVDMPLPMSLPATGGFAVSCRSSCALVESVAAELPCRPRMVCTSPNDKSQPNLVVAGSKLIIYKNEGRLSRRPPLPAVSSFAISSFIKLTVCYVNCCCRNSSFVRQTCCKVLAGWKRRSKLCQSVMRGRRAVRHHTSCWIESCTPVLFFVRCPVGACYPACTSLPAPCLRSFVAFPPSTRTQLTS